MYLLPHATLPSLFVSSNNNDDNNNHSAIIEQAAKTIPLLSIYIFADGLQSGFNSIVKGCGRQSICVPIVLFSYWIVGVPLAYYLGLVRGTAQDDDDNIESVCVSSTSTSTTTIAEDAAAAASTDDGNNTTTATTMIVLCGDVGLVAGMTAGTWCHMLLLAFVVLGTTDWKKEAAKAQQRVKQKNKKIM